MYVSIEKKKKEPSASSTHYGHIPKEVAEDSTT